MIATWDELFDLLFWSSINVNITNVTVTSGVAEVNVVTIEQVVLDGQSGRIDGTYTFKLIKRGGKWFISDMEWYYD